MQRVMGHEVMFEASAECGTPLPYPMVWVPSGMQAGFVPQYWAAPEVAKAACWEHGAAHDAGETWACHQAPEIWARRQEARPTDDDDVALCVAHEAPDLKACLKAPRGTRRAHKSRRRRHEGASWSAEIAQLSTPGEGRREVLAGLRGNFASLAFDPQGCHLAQAALDVASREEQAELAFELRGWVREAAQCPFANYVAQKMVEVMPPAEVAFMVTELIGAAVETAQHRCGCRVICRLLEHCPHEQTHGLVDEILQAADVLCRHSYGKYVVKHLIEHGTTDQRRAVVETLLKDPLSFAVHKTGSDVVESFLHEEGHKLAWVLLYDQASVVHLASSRYGSYVARALLRLPGEEGKVAHERLALVSPDLHQSKFGKRVLAELQVRGATGASKL